MFQAGLIVPLYSSTAHCHLFTTEETNPEDPNLARQNENCVRENENSCNKVNGQRESVNEPPVLEVRANEEISIPPGGRTSIVIMCTAM